MDWLRRQQKWGVQLALFALMLKTVLAFGHHHFDGSAHHHSLPHAHAIAHHNNEAHGHDHDGDHAHKHAQDTDHAHHHDSPAHHHDAAKACSDCLTLAAASLTSAAFALARYQVVALTDCAVSYKFVNLVYDRAAFRSRAPPLLSDAA